MVGAAFVLGLRRRRGAWGVTGAATGARGSGDFICRRLRLVRGEKWLGKLLPSSNGSGGRGRVRGGGGKASRGALQSRGRERGAGHSEWGEGELTLVGHVARARGGAGGRRKTTAAAAAPGSKARVRGEGGGASDGGGLGRAAA